MKNPVFISGLRKSGTSMIKNLLDGHPELFIYPPNELHFFRYSAHESVVKDKTATVESPDELLDTLARIHFVHRLDDQSHSDFRESVDVDRFDEAIDDHDPKSYPEAYKALFESMAAAASHTDAELDSDRPVSKTVLETEFFPLLRQWFPYLKFVHVLRNPYRHFASARNSMRITDGSKGDEMTPLKDPYPFIGSELWRMELSYYFMRTYRRLYPEQFYVLAYDDILREPEATLRDLADSLDVDYESSMTDPTVSGEPWGGNSWYQEEFEGIDSSPLNHWKDDISSLETRIITDLYDDLLDEFDFERLPAAPSTVRPLHVAERPWTYVANRIAYLWQKRGTA